MNDATDLHVTITVTRDDGRRQMPTVYVRDRASFDDEGAAVDYVARLRAWVADRPLVDEVGAFHPWPVEPAEPFSADRLDTILSLERWPA